MDLEESGIVIKTLVVVDCHGVTLAKRDDPYNKANEVTVEYPTILTAHLGTQTRVCGNVDNQADQICSIVSEYIGNEPDRLPDSIPFEELTYVLKHNAVCKTGYEPNAVFSKCTPIKPKFPNEHFQNIELFCPGVRKDSGYPVGNIDGVWVCDLRYRWNNSTNVTGSMFKDGLKYDETGKVLQKYVNPHGKDNYNINTSSWVNHSDRTPVTYRHLVEKLKETGYQPETTAILLATCRCFDDDPDDKDCDSVPSAPTKRNRRLDDDDEDDFLTMFADLEDADSVESSKSVKKPNIRDAGGSNKKRRYTKRKKYFNSSRRVKLNNKVNKLKKRRTCKYKNKK